jgi:adenine-specific DNA-methyltransferase
MKKRGQRINYATLHRRILAYELVGREAVKARSRVARILRAEGLTSQTAKRVATAWIKTGDFLLSNRRSRHFSHVVGNPPFVRWSRIPAKLRTAYERHLPPMIAKGDLQLPFLHSSFESLAGDGRLAFVCSDRWRHMAYGSEFKTALLAKARMRLRPIVERPPFAKRVNAYADLLILENVLPAQTVLGSDRAGEPSTNSGAVSGWGPHWDAKSPSQADAMS